MADFTLTIQDSSTSNEIALDNFEISFFDFDVNRAENLHELVCVNLDQFDLAGSSLPVSDPDDVTVDFRDADCDDYTDSPTGSVKLMSNGVGFVCDNPYDP